MRLPGRFVVRVRATPFWAMSPGYGPRRQDRPLDARARRPFRPRARKDRFLAGTRPPGRRARLRPLLSGPFHRSSRPRKRSSALDTIRLVPRLLLFLLLLLAVATLVKLSAARRNKPLGELLAPQGLARRTEPACAFRPCRPLLRDGLRGLAEGNSALAFANARSIVEAEQSLGLFIEQDVPELGLWANGCWSTSRTSCTSTRTSSSPAACSCGSTCGTTNQFYFVRNMFMVAMGLALVGYLSFPTAPPRFLPELGFVDTIAYYADVRHDSVAVVCIWWTLRSLARVSERSLLAGRLVSEQRRQPSVAPLAGVGACGVWASGRRRRADCSRRHWAGEQHRWVLRRGRGDAGLVVVLSRVEMAATLPLRSGRARVVARRASRHPERQRPPRAQRDVDGRHGVGDVHPGLGRCLPPRRRQRRA